MPMSVRDIPKEGYEFLDILQDHAVGGKFLTPGIMSYSNMNVKRTALLTPADWAKYEGVHVNAAKSSLTAAYKDAGWSLKTLPRTLYDRVLVLDFDIYNKDGSLSEGQEPITPKSVIERLKSEGRPLPFCYTYSETKGNFHMIWVYDKPQIRAKDNQIAKGIAAYWGADTMFTNSIMRNPIYRTLHLNTHNQGTHWYTEWTDTSPRLQKKEDVAPVWEKVAEKGLLAKPLQLNKEIKKTLRRGCKYGKFQFRLSDAALHAIMATAKDGDGRWYMLRSFITRKIMQVWREAARVLTASEIRAVVDEGNSMFAEPMCNRRKASLAVYWTTKQQYAYVNRQKAAGDNWYTRMRHRQGVVFYFQVIDMKKHLADHLADPIAHPLTDEQQELSDRFTGRKYHGKVPILSYIAWMLQVEPTYKTDPGTGEMTVAVTPTARVKSIIGNAYSQKWDREEYERILTEEAENEEAAELSGEVNDEPLPANPSSHEPELTGKQISCKLPELKRPQRSNSPPTKGRLYACH